MSAKGVIELIESGDYGSFMSEAGSHAIEELALRYHNKISHLNELLELLDLYRRAKRKIPELLRFMPALNRKGLEQCTSESVAQVRASRIGKGNRLLNLSGGLGIDDLAFAPYFSEIVSLDPDKEINRIFRYNCQKAGVRNIKRIDVSAEEFLNKAKPNSFEVIYADPDRRTGKHKGDVLTHQPDVFGMFERLMQIAGKLELKLSPLVDTEQLAEINGVESIHCISLLGEMKEVWVRFGRDRNLKKEVQREALMIEKNLECKCYSNSGFLRMSSEVEPEKYVFSSHAAMKHSRLSFHLAEEYGMGCLSAQGQIFTSDALPGKWYGKIYEHQHTELYKVRNIRKYVSKKDIASARILTSGSRLKPQKLYAEMKVKEGGEDYFLFFNSEGKEYFSHLLRYRA